jgi:hypothetical protein
MVVNKKKTCQHSYIFNSTAHTQNCVEGGKGTLDNEQDRQYMYNVTLLCLHNVYTPLSCSNSLILFHLKRALLWQFKVSRNNKMDLVQVPNFNQIWNFSTDFDNSPQY